METHDGANQSAIMYSCQGLHAICCQLSFAFLCVGSSMSWIFPGCNFPPYVVSVPVWRHHLYQAVTMDMDIINTSIDYLIAMRIKPPLVSMAQIATSVSIIYFVARQCSDEWNG